MWRALSRDPEGVCRLTLMGKGGGKERILREAEIDTAEHSGAYQWGVFRRAIRERRSISAEYARRIVSSIELVNSFTQQCLRPENAL